MCARRLTHGINKFCYNCKAPASSDWTTGNNSLDIFIKESWSRMVNPYDSYIQWIEFSLLKNIKETASLPHKCTHMAEWLESTADKLTKVTLKKMGLSFDRDQVIILCVKYCK